GGAGHYGQGARHHRGSQSAGRRAKVRDSGSDALMEQDVTAQPAAPDQPADLNDQIAARLDKRRRLLESGPSPYGGRFARTHTAGEILDGFAELEGSQVRIAGRLRSIRRQGKVTFADLQDGGRRIQLFCRVNTMGEAAYRLWDSLDIGDIVGASGQVMRTRTGQESVEVHELTLLAK